MGARAGGAGCAGDGCQKFLEAVRQRTYDGGGASIMYLVSGTKPQG